MPLAGGGGGGGGGGGDGSDATTRDRDRSMSKQRPKRDDADIHGVYVLSNNEEFHHVPATDGIIHRGTLIFGDLLYVFQAFSRQQSTSSALTNTSTPPLTYLSIFGVSSERTVRFRIQRGEFIPEQDLQVMEPMGWVRARDTIIFPSRHHHIPLSTPSYSPLNTIIFPSQHHHIPSQHRHNVLSTQPINSPFRPTLFHYFPRLPPFSSTPLLLPNPTLSGSLRKGVCR